MKRKFSKFTAGLLSAAVLMSNVAATSASEGYTYDDEDITVDLTKEDEEESSDDSDDTASEDTYENDQAEDDEESDVDTDDDTEDDEDVLEEESVSISASDEGDNETLFEIQIDESEFSDIKITAFDLDEYEEVFDNDDYLLTGLYEFVLFDEDGEEADLSSETEAVISGSLLDAADAVYSFDGSDFEELELSENEDGEIVITLTGYSIIAFAEENPDIEYSSYIKDSEGDIYFRIRIEGKKDDLSDIQSMEVLSAKVSLDEKYSLIDAFYISFLDEDGKEVVLNAEMSVYLSGSVLSDYFVSELTLSDGDGNVIELSKSDDGELYFETESLETLVVAQGRAENILTASSDEFEAEVTGDFCNTDALFVNVLSSDEFEDYMPEAEEDVIYEVIAAVNLSILDRNQEAVSGDFNIFITNENVLPDEGKVHLYAVFDGKMEEMQQVTGDTVSFDTDELADAYVYILERGVQEVILESTDKDITVVVTGDEKSLDAAEEVVIEKLGDEAVEEKQIEIEEAGIEGYTILDVFDVTLLDADGNETEPDDTVNVALSGSLVESYGGADNIILLHFTEDEIETIAMDTVSEEEIAFTTDSFSTYATASTGYISEINSFTVQFASGATKNSSGDYVWTADYSTSGHKFKFRVNFSMSGVSGTLGAAVVEDDEVKAADFEIRIPAHILKDKNGNYADTVYMSYPSMDEVEDMTTSEYNEADGFAYYTDGDEIVIYNFKDIESAVISGYFEVSYATSKTTFNYYDYGQEDSASDIFTASISVLGQSEALTASATGNAVYIDTGAEITSVTKKYPTRYDVWDSSWGDSSDFYDYDSGDWYLVFPIVTEITAEVTQYYNFTLSDTSISYKVGYSDGSSVSGSSASGSAVSIIGIKFSGESSYTFVSSGENTISRTLMNLSSDGKRYDYVLVKIDSSLLTNATSVSITNKITATVDPADGADSDTSASSSKTYRWTQPAFSVPSGSFNIWKYGNENYSQYWGEYMSYDLAALADKEADSLDGIKYRTEMSAYPYPWTLKSGSSSSDYTAYGQTKVGYTITDDTMYLLYNDGTDAKGNDWSNCVEYYSSYGDYFSTSEDYDTAFQLEADDYDIDYVTWSVSMTDADRDEDGNTYIDDDTAKFVIKRVSTANKGTFTLDIKVDGEWINSAAVYDFSSSSATISSSYVTGFTSSKITFAKGVDGYRLSTSNYYYYTNVNLYTYIILYGTEDVLAFIGDEDIVLLRNAVTLEADQDESNIVTITKVIGDRLCKPVLDSDMTKKMTAFSSSSTSKTITLTWRLHIYETITTGNGDISYVTQDTGTFYDLLPEGATYESGSVIVKSGGSTWKSTENSRVSSGSYLNEDEDYTVEVIDNYADSGRVMLVITIKTLAPYYTIWFNSVHSWDSISDYGTDVLNTAVYETGNEDIYDGVTQEVLAASSDELSYFTGLDSSGEEVFLYDDASYDIDTEFSATTNLNKKVKATEDDTYSLDASVENDGTYSYRIRYMNTYTAISRNIIFYDSLENYSLTEDGETYESEWHGELLSVDTSQLESMGASPVVYYSTEESLKFQDDEGNAINTDLSDTDIWTASTKYTGDLSDVTAVAVDCSKSSSGGTFVLEDGESLVYYLYMQDSGGLDEELEYDLENGIYADYPETYNNIYMSMDITTSTDTSFSSASSTFIHHDYTTVVYSITADVPVVKVSSEDTTQVISGITFRLWGTSIYGTEVDETETSDRYGELIFEGIEPGTYTLQEYEEDEEWIFDYTEHTVVIDTEGNVTIDGETVGIEAAEDGSDIYYTIENDPRIHADISFYKRNYQNTSTRVKGATFLLEGVSDYGTDVFKYAESSSSSGTVTFSNIEMGTYTLTEVIEADGYAINGMTYTAKVDENALVSIVSGYEDDEDTEDYLYTNGLYYYVYDVPLRDIRLFKRSSYDLSAIQGVVFHLYGTSDSGTEYDLYSTSDENGYIDFEDLEPGAYILEEYGYEGYTDEDGNEVTADKLNASYVLDATKRVVVVEADGTITIDGLTANAYGNYVVVNTKLPSDTVTVIKSWVGGVATDDDGNVVLPTIHIAASGVVIVEFTVEDDDGKALSGAEFTITDEDGKTAETITAQDVTFGLTEGTYTLTQTTTPSGYTAIDTTTFTVGLDGTITISTSTSTVTVTQADDTTGTCAVITAINSNQNS